mgnify:CR=1 FL=1
MLATALFDRPDVRWEAVGPPEDFPEDTYVPKVITETSGVGEIGKNMTVIESEDGLVVINLHTCSAWKSYSITWTAHGA